MSSLRIKLAIIVASICPIGVFAATASADSATPFPQSQCTADGNAGSTNIVLKDGVLVITGCHSGSASPDNIVVSSGTCHGEINMQRENIVCTKQ